MLKPVRKVCPSCKLRFTTNIASKRYCSAPCKAKAFRLAQKQSASLHLTAFGEWLIRKCQKAGTVQILTGAPLNELFELWRNCRKANGFGPEEELGGCRFEISHIAPSTHPSILGTLNPHNLVIAPAPYNRARYNNWDGVSGRWIHKSGLLSKWRVDAGESAVSVAQKIKEFDPQGFEILMSDFTLTTSARQKTIKRLVKLGIGTSRALDKLTYEQLDVLSKGNPKSPKRATLIRHLLDLEEPPLSAKELDALPLQELQALHTLRVQPKLYIVERAAQYEVYCQEAERLGYAVQKYWCFQYHATELWDGLHGAPVTIDFNTTFDTSDADYGHLF